MAESDSPPAQPAQTAHPTNQMDQLSGQDVEGQPLEPQQIGDSGALDIPNRREDKSFLASPSTQLDIGKSEAKGGLPGVYFLKLRPLCFRSSLMPTTVR